MIAAVASRPAPENFRHISAKDVRDLCGGVSDMSLWRWLNDPEMNFPKPVYIGKRRYWQEAEIIAWLQAQQAERAQ